MNPFFGTCLATGCGLLLVSQPKADEPKKSAESPVRVLILKSSPPGVKDGNTWKKPALISSDEALRKVIERKDARAEINEKVDFKKEQVLIFSWSGSGEDKLLFAVDQGKAVFYYTPGLTRDLRPHFYAYVLKNKTPWEVKFKER